MATRPVKTAFPVPEDATQQLGMTLREWFAGMALQGIIAGAEVSLDRDEAAQVAFEFADAMMKRV